MSKYVLILLALLVFVTHAAAPSEKRIPKKPEEAKLLQAATAKKLGIPVEKSVQIAEDVNIVFVLIPAGTFEMGSPAYELKRKSDEGPVHLVTITKPFYMGKYEITQKQYTSLMTPDKAFKFMGADLPAENIEWNQAMMFCRQASQKTEKNITLPTEAQWEYACRAGTTTAFFTGEQITYKQANYDWDDSYNGSPKVKPLKRTMKVGSFAPNAFGLHDMHGNVWEFCRDKHKGDFYKMSPEKDPLYDKDKGFRVVRGGGWDCNPEKLRSANRSQRPQDADRHNLGFRVVMAID